MTGKNTLKNKPKIIPRRFIGFMFAYFLVSAVPLLLSFGMSLLTANISGQYTVQQLFDNQLQNGLLYGTISLLVMSIFSFLLFHSKVDRCWGEIVKTIANVAEGVEVLVLLFLFYSMIILALGDSYCRICPSAKAIFIGESFSMVLCVLIQCVTHPDSFIE